MEAQSKQVSEITEVMNEETYGYFISGLRVAIKAAGYSDNDFADGIMHKVTLSNNLTRKTRMRDENIEKCARKLNKDVSELVLIGKMAEAPDAAQQPPPQVAGVQANYVMPTDVLSAVSTLVGQYHKNDERMRFWRAVFESLPIAALIIKDGVVTYQNTKSRELGSTVGGPICDTCTRTGCADRCRDCQQKGDCEECDCPISMAMNLTKETTGFLLYNGRKYQVNVSPLPFSDHEYFVVVATEVERYEGEDRRSGSDRRSEK